MSHPVPASDERLEHGASALRQRIGMVVALGGLVTAVVVALTVDGQLGMWGLFPVVVYAVLVLLELNVVLSTAIALLVALVMSRTTPVEAGTLMSESLGSFIAVVGLIIMLGGGLGAVASETGAARTLVAVLLRRVGMSTPGRAQVGIMLASTVLVGALGTLAGANAILAPLVIPVAAAASRSRPAVAIMLHTAGAAGLIVGPYTPPVVSIMGAAEISYVDYLLHAGLPMAVVVWGVGFVMARVIHRRTAGDQYEEEVAARSELDRPSTASEKRAALAFIGTILVMTALGIWLEPGFTWAIVTMLVTTVTTALAAGLAAPRVMDAFFRGAGNLVWLFLLFWLFNPLLVVMEGSGAYESMLSALEPTLESVGPWGFLMLVLVVGWIGIAGAAVAQVVLINQLFAPLAMSLGIPPGLWAAALLGGSQIDWFGPFPNADMIAQMGLARSSNLKMMLINGWTVMAATLVMFAALFLLVL